MHPSIIQTIEQDHRRVSEQLSDLIQLPRDAHQERKTRFHSFFLEAEAQIRAEREVLYDQIMHQGLNRPDSILKLAEDHQRLDGELYSLHEQAQTTEDWEADLDILRERLETHFRREESEWDNEGKSVFLVESSQEFLDKYHREKENIKSGLQQTLST